MDFRFASELDVRRRGAHRRVSGSAKTSGKRLLPLESSGRCRPKGADGSVPIERPVYLETEPSLTPQGEPATATAVVRRWPASTGTGFRLAATLKPTLPDFSCNPATSIPLCAKLCTVDVARIGSGLNSILRAARRMSAFTKPLLISPDRNAQLLQRIPFTSGPDGQVFGV
jgi:hypothetical protein